MHASAWKHRWYRLDHTKRLVKKANSSHSRRRRRQVQTTVGRRQTFDTVVRNLGRTASSPAIYRPSQSPMSRARATAGRVGSSGRPAVFIARSGRTRDSKFRLFGQAPGHGITPAAMDAGAPDLYAEIYMNQIYLVISACLGINEAVNIGRSVHFLKSTCIFLLIIFASFYVQSVARRRERQRHGVFLLLWRAVGQIVVLVQGFLTAVVVNILTTKMSENDAESKFMDVRSRMMLYLATVMFLVCITNVFQWYFYEKPETEPGRQLPAQLIKDMTADDLASLAKALGFRPRT
jgi:hypothetical protein